MPVTLHGACVTGQLTCFLIFIVFQEPTLLTLENSAQIFNALSDLPGELTDADELLQVKNVNCRRLKTNEKNAARCIGNEGRLSNNVPYSTV